METIKGRSENTVNGYFIDLRTFFRFLLIQRDIVQEQNDHQPDIKLVNLDLLRSVTLNDLFEFMNYAKSDRANSNVTRARKVSSLRRFFYYLSDVTHQIEDNPAKNLSLPKLPSRMPQYLTLDQSLELLSLAKNGKYAERDYCILTLLLNCGLRRAEIAGLNLSDIRGDNSLRVIGKGNKERIVYFGTPCRKAIDAYMIERNKKILTDNKALFGSRNNNRISTEAVHRLVKKALLQAGLDADQFSAHKLRHTAATMMLSGGVDVKTVQEVLGHENLNTTQIYTHIENTELKLASQANPLSKLDFSDEK
jgi:site-specific recombinase XerD